MRWAPSVLFLVACASGGTSPRVLRDAPMDAVAPDDAPATPDVPGRDTPGLDAPPECGTGESRACTTACTTMGTERCVAEHWAGCEAPPEDCNGRDDDCDGAIDDGIAPRACSSGCGGGSETCTAGSWSGCTATMPMPETCNALDDDCDSRVDETLTRGCSTACGSGTETCTRGTFAGCTAPAPRTETCNGIDDDCNGTIDQITRACSTACGSGTERCTSGAFSGCTAPPVIAETCNRADDDCNGVVDDGLQVTVFDPVSQAELSAAQPSCVSSSSGLDVCLTASHRWCGTRGCYDSGVGLLQAVPGSARVVCLGPRAATVVATTFADVSTGSGITVSGSNVASRVALSASNRFCRSRGYEGGYGPIEHASPAFYVTCVSAPAAGYRSIATADLRARGCDPILNPDALACASAADGWCRDAGFEGGWGPVEWNDTDSAVVCVREP